MCGASSQQMQLQQAQIDFYNQGTAEAEQTYAEDQSLLKQMQAVYDPILAKGPNQEGFSEAELNDLNATAVDTTAQNYQSAAKAVNEELAAEGGGDSSLTTGAATQLKEQTAESAARQESAEESQIKQADYAQGYNEFQGATAALEDVSGQYNPIGYSGAATGAGSAASTTANEIAQENNSWINAAIGAAASIAGDVATGGMDNLGAGKGFFG